MNFNDKLIDLRKKKGLSQEELGYELNVTRQTVSKWELGQTKPEMDKLIEISKYFNISVDELLDEENNKEKKQKVGFNWKPIVIICALLIILLIFVVYCVFSLIKGVGNFFGSVTSEAFDDMSEMTNLYTNTVEKIGEIGVEYSKQMENKYNEFDVGLEEDNQNNFNLIYTSLYQGITSGFHLKNAINKVINDNLNNERKIEVEYQETITKEQEEIINIRKKFEDFTEYMVSYEYDEEGHICKMIIKDI